MNLLLLPVSNQSQYTMMQPKQKVNLDLMTGEGGGGKEGESDGADDPVEFRAYSSFAVEGLRRRQSLSARDGPLLHLLRRDSLMDGEGEGADDPDDTTGTARGAADDASKGAQPILRRPPIERPPRLSITTPTPPTGTATATTSTSTLKPNVVAGTISTPSLLSMSPSLRPVSILSYVKSSLYSDPVQTKATLSQIATIENNLLNFVSVPHRLEQLLAFGFLISMDCFLYAVTFLPVKVVMSIASLCFTVVHVVSKGSVPCPPFLRFNRANLYDLIRGVLILVSCTLLKRLSLGILYHWIRGQAMIKLYVLIAIMEVFDRLLCSFGQDAFDCLYWNSRLRPSGRRMVGSGIIVLVYVCFHSVILYLHIATLNVAMNSSDQSLLTLLVSGNFAEIKGSVFKKFDKQNLFQLTCSDIIERFKLLLFLHLILLINLCQDGAGGIFKEFLKVAFIVLLGELFADWVKHSFITKFNNIKSTVYSDYTLILCGDLVGQEKHESTHAINKRLGMAQIPYACVVVRMLMEAGKYSSYFFSSSTAMVAAAFSALAILMITKIFLGLLVRHIANVILGPEDNREREIRGGGGEGHVVNFESFKKESPCSAPPSVDTELLNKMSPTGRSRLNRKSMTALNNLDRFNITENITEIR